jgi:hypothetical protein
MLTNNIHYKVLPMYFNITNSGRLEMYSVLLFSVTFNESFIHWLRTTNRGVAIPVGDTPLPLIEEDLCPPSILFSRDLVHRIMCMDTMILNVACSQLSKHCLECMYITDFSKFV